MNISRPLAGTQNFIKIYHEKLAESTAYNLGGFYKLKKNVDIGRLKHSMIEVMHSHEAFRTKLMKDGDTVLQVLGEEIEEPEIIETTEANLSSITDNLVHPYELYGNFLYRCVIIRTQADAYLFFEMHHILTDGTSMNNILREIGEAYGGQQIEKDNYFQLIQEKIDAQGTEKYQLDKKYYQAKIPSKERVYMPAFDYPDEGFLPGFMRCQLEVTGNDLANASKKYGLSPTKLFIMCYLMALSKVTGMKKVGTAYTVHGRFNELSKNVVGLLLYSYFINLDITDGDTIDEIARKMRMEMEEVRSHGSFDCTTFMTESNIEEIACSNILYQGQIRDFLEDIKDLAEEEIELPNNYYKASYFCEFEILDCGDYMYLDFYYNASRYSEETARQMLHTYRDVSAKVLK